MAISNPSLFTNEQNKFVDDVTRGIVGPPKGVFPHMPQRTQWNADWPYLHTIQSAIAYIVRTNSDNDKGVSALMVADELEAMGFGRPDVNHTVSSCLGTSRSAFGKIICRHYPKDGGKSWSMYAMADAVDRINQKHERLAQWLDTAENVNMLDMVVTNVKRRGVETFWTRRR